MKGFMSTLIHRLQRFLRLRFAVLYPLAIYLVFFTMPRGGRSALLGVALIAAGMVMRLWSNGYAIKLDKLTTSGPYAFVRNPLYVGTALILLGFGVLLIKVLWVGLLFAAGVVAAYVRTIRNEEKMLTDKFGSAYLDYRAGVPAMWPALRPYAVGEKWPFSLPRVWHSREHKVVLWGSILVIAFYIKKEIMVPGECAQKRIIWLVIAACILALLDAAGEYVRARQKKG